MNETCLTDWPISPYFHRLRHYSTVVGSLKESKKKGTVRRRKWETVSKLIRRNCLAAIVLTKKLNHWRHRASMIRLFH